MKLLVKLVVCAVSLGVTSCKTSKTKTANLEGYEPSSLDFAIELPCLQVPAGFKPAQGLDVEPDKGMTPGVLCKNPTRLSYKEQIKRCERNVTNDTKDQVFHTYQNAGLLSRSYASHTDFKVDHLIPLCAGGDNDIKNLWPQHTTIGAFTDPIEPRLCALMGAGQMLQREAVKIILGVKRDYKTAYDVCVRLDKRLGIRQ